jgi:hypothetical protein
MKKGRKKERRGEREREGMMAVVVVKYTTLTRTMTKNK